MTTGAPSGVTRQWLTPVQSKAIEETFLAWDGECTGHSKELAELAAKLGLKLSKVKRRMKYLRHQRNSAITGTKSPKKTVKTSRIRHHALTAPSAFSSEHIKWVSSSISLGIAVKIVEKAQSLARELSLAPIAVAVLDAGGNTVVVQREDGAGLLRPEIAKAKAWGAISMGVSSRTIRDRLKEEPEYMNALSSISQGKLAPVPGGVLIMNKVTGEVVGAVGISGDTSEKDEYVAIEGIKSTQLQPEPAEPIQGWQNSNYSGTAVAHNLLTSGV